MYLNKVLYGVKINSCASIELFHVNLVVNIQLFDCCFVLVDFSTMAKWELDSLPIENPLPNDNNDTMHKGQGSYMQQITDDYEAKIEDKQ